MRPVDFPESNVVAGKHQEQYRDLPAWTDNRTMISCWGLTLWERLRLLLTGRLWIAVLVFGQPVQPILPQTKRPFRRGDTGEAWLQDHEKADA